MKIKEENRPFFEVDFNAWIRIPVLSLWSHAASQLPHLAQCWPHPSPNPPLGPIP
jgi:hypothetical protein